MITITSQSLKIQKIPFMNSLKDHLQKINPHLQEYGYYEAAKQCAADVAAWTATLDNKAVKEGMVEYIALFNKAEMYLMQQSAEMMLSESYSNGEDFNR